MSPIAQSSRSLISRDPRLTDLMNHESRAGEAFKSQMQALEAILPLKWHAGPDKTPAETQRKADRKYNGDTSKVEDKYRGRAITPRENFDFVLKGIVDELKKNGAPVKIKDERDGKSLSGYPCVYIHQNSCEIQLVTPETYAMIDVTHDFYKWMVDVKNMFKDVAMPPHVEKDFHQKRQRTWLLNQATLATPAFA